MTDRVKKKMFLVDTNLKKYDNEAYTKNPLLRLRISEIRERRHYGFLKKTAEQVWTYNIYMFNTMVIYNSNYLKGVQT